MEGLAEGKENPELSHSFQLGHSFQPWVLWWFVRERSGLNLSFFSISVNTLEKVFLPSYRGTTLTVPADSGTVPV